MRQNRIEEVNRDLDFARHNMNGLIALFGYKSNSMIWNNKTRVLCMADCIIDIMTELKETIKNDDGKGGTE
jgi:hypothetical protein